MPPDTNLPTAKVQVLQKPELTPTEEQARNRYNEWKRHLKSLPSPNQQYSVRQLWHGALQILDSEDQEGKQKLARDLVDTELCGMQHILYLMELRIEGIEPGSNLWNFLLVITHTDLLHCLAIDTFVGTLYNFVSGSNGSRAIPFFRRLCAIVASTDTLSGVQYSTLLITTATAIRWLLRKEFRARFREDLPALIEEMEEFATNTVMKTGESQDTANRQILEMKAIAKMSNDAITAYDKEPSHPISVYPKQIKPPGGRHDNDHADINRIEIFPTTEEIISDQPDFLPFSDRNLEHHLIDQAARHVDTQFRLLRHDTFAEMKNALGRLHFVKGDDPRKAGEAGLDLIDLSANQYKGTFISHISFSKLRGLEFHLSFPQPRLPALRNLSNSEKAEWWKNSKRLVEGLLLSFSTTNTRAQMQHLFFTVTSKGLQQESKNSSGRQSQQNAIVVVKLASTKESDLRSALYLSCSKSQGLLIEFPGIIPATFKPILEHLQVMQLDGRLPFQEWILPSRIGDSSQQILDIPPPAYARKANFRFSLKSIYRDGDEGTLLDPNHISNKQNFKNIAQRTSLDRGQYKALIAALTREFAFIQGPPGTGKSYLGVHLMKVLLDHKQVASLGPIVVVCFTNHALDQFLEHLLKDGIKKIIRIGGQSKSALLKHHNLQEIRRTEEKTRSENYLAATSYKELDKHETSVNTELDKLDAAFKPNSDWKNLNAYLQMHHPKIHCQFRRVDDEAFHVVGKHPFQSWIAGGIGNYQDNISLDDLLEKGEQNVQSLTRRERFRLLTFWKEDQQDRASSSLFEQVKSATATLGVLNNVHAEASRRVLGDCDVIGVTTTGLAKHISILQHIKSKVVICEEAGEVMEPHMMCALLPAVEHFIQIGDHQQLRPHINTYSLSLECGEGRPYQLDRSQFERLSIGEPGRMRMPLVQLDQQRRMQPEISSLIRETLYPNLKDHTDTLHRDNVTGMRSNVFWLDHVCEENGHDTEQYHKSHSNDHEVALVHAIARHVIRQGIYSSNDIAILTPYTGQLSKLRTAMQNDFEIVLSDQDQEALEKEELNDQPNLTVDVSQERNSTTTVSTKKKLSELLRIATIDNFQGEEAKIIIISLVRSNKPRQVGFLRTTNRINVFLSRAQNGMYLVGNADTYSDIPMWQKVIDLLRARNSIGKSIGLCCPRHRGTPLEATNPGDFLKVSPEGGCQLACEWRLECGHRCQSRYHSESMHKIAPCSEPCQRFHEPCKHACQRPTCGEPCGVCKIIIRNVDLLCGHRMDVLCHETQNLQQIRCTTNIQKQVVDCKHLIWTHCSTDVTEKGFKCPYQGEELFDCGHSCLGKCGDCRTVSENDLVMYQHRQCRVKCKKPQGSCDHICGEPCHQNQECGLCRLPCQVQCQHSKCELLCHETCAPCIETCTWSCEHQGTCSMPCGAPCDRLPCDERCGKLLACGHRCPGVCGEVCPEGYCHQCSETLDKRVDLLEMKTFAEIDPDEEPIIVLGCGHFFTIQSLDGMIGMQDLYTFDQSGRFSGFQDISKELALKIPKCPDCKCPIRQHIANRYGRLINRSVVDDMTKRSIIYGRTELSRLMATLDTLDQNLQATRADFKRQVTVANAGKITKTVLNRAINKRRCLSMKPQKALKEFAIKMDDKNQPARKIHEAIVHAMRKKEVSLEDRLTAMQLQSDEALGPIRPIVLGSRLAQIKHNQIVLQDKLFVANSIQDFHENKCSVDELAELTSPYFKACQTLIKDCIEGKLPRLAVQTTLCFAGLADCYRSSITSNYNRIKADQYVHSAQELLTNAIQLCDKGFSGAQFLAEVAHLTFKRLAGPHYEEVTIEEKAMIREAMLKGRDSIASHSGHWYNCENGHPVSSMF